MTGVAALVGVTGSLAQPLDGPAGTKSAALVHLQALQDIADAHDGNRAAGTEGYEASADYVARLLADAGYQVRSETFEFPYFREVAPPRLTVGGDAVRPPDGETRTLRTLALSGSGEIAAPLVAVDLGIEDGQAPGPSDSACSTADFQDFTRGAIALVRRGTCRFQVKLENAMAAGAAGMIVMNEGTERRRGLFAGRLGEQAPVPVAGVAFETGVWLAERAATGASAVLAVDVESGTRQTRNVLADAGGGGGLIVVGAHLDSVDEGPGMNDNASGTVAVLEAALRLAEEGLAGRAVRFAFWGAEEAGLIGSRRHVERLAEDERAGIAAYVNLDMVGSINAGHFVHLGEGAGEGPAARLGEMLAAGLRERDLAVRVRTVRGDRSRSDDAAFRSAGIATVGLYTGAGERMSEDSAGLFGGVAGEPYDPCYHKACDRLENVDVEIVEKAAAALAEALKGATGPQDEGDGDTAPGSVRPT